MRYPKLPLAKNKEEGEEKLAKVRACLGGCGRTRKGKHFTCEKCQVRNSGLGKAAKSCKTRFGLPKYDL